MFTFVFYEGLSENQCKVASGERQNSDNTDSGKPPIAGF